MGHRSLPSGSQDRCVERSRSERTSTRSTKSWKPCSTMARLNLLLDTHILLWWLASSRRLPSAAREAILRSPVVFVSAASVWEIGIKVAAGRLDFRGDLEEHLAINHFSALP